MGEWVCLGDEKLNCERVGVKGIRLCISLEAVRLFVILLSGVSFREGSAFYALKFILVGFFVLSECLVKCCCCGMPHS